MVRHWYAGSAEERMMQLLRLINGLLEKHPESRSRKLAAHAPIIVPVYSQVQLVLTCIGCRLGQSL